MSINILKQSQLTAFFALNNQNFITRIFILSLWLFPLLFFLLHKWVNIFSVILACSGCILLWQQSKHPPLTASAWWVVSALSAMLLAVLISSALRGHFLITMFDSPTHYLLAIPVFFVIVQKKINFSRMFEYVCPISLLLFATQAIIHPLTFNGSARLIAPALSDPNLLGIYTMTFAVVCLATIKWRAEARLLIFLKILGFVSGVLLSIATQSRSGWFSGCVLLIFYLGLHYRHMSIKNLIIIALMALGIVLVFYHVETLHARVHDALYEILLWLHGQNQETSCGSRLTMWLISFRLFSLHPLQGYADHHLMNYFNDPYIAKVGTPYALSVIQHIGPHNDVLQNMILSGVFGLIAILLIIFVPLILFLRIYLNTQAAAPRKACLQGLYMIIGIFAGSFFNVLLGLKMSIAFYALVVYSLLATALWMQQKIK